MDYGSLGPGGPRISRLCLGSNNFGKQLDEATSRAVMSEAFELGINMVDTADVYNDGRSEEIIGKVIQGNRSQFMVATKVGIVTDGGQRTANLSRKYIDRQVKESLKRLRTDYIDLYYLHRFDPQTPLEETLETLDGLVRRGKVRYMGVSNFSVEQLDRIIKICETRGFAKPVAVQTQYNLLTRDAEKDLFPYAKANGACIFTYSPLWGGFLTGKYRVGEAPPQGSRGEANRRYWDRIKNEGDFQLVERMRSVASEAGISLRELALAWILNNPEISAPIIGVSTADQLVEDCSVLNLHLESKTLSELDLALGRDGSKS
jgi:1-deoxyxylulose-5-phosphate synthase